MVALAYFGGFLDGPIFESREFFFAKLVHGLGRSKEIKYYLIMLI